jgi:peptidoglycan hydrolase-like protein with peptidoglycan-binding domain
MRERMRGSRIGGSSSSWWRWVVLGGVLVMSGPGALPALATGQEAGGTVVVDDTDAALHDLDLIGTEIRQVQQGLRDRGYFVGPADGRKEERLRTALREFQRAEGLPVTGGLDKGTLVKLGLALPDVSTASAEPAEARVDPVLPSEEPAQVESEQVSAPEATAQPAPTEARAPKKSEHNRDVVSIGRAGVAGVGRGVTAAGRSVKNAGVTTGEAVGTGGKAVGKASATAAEATSTAATTSAKAVKVGAVAVATAPIKLYSAGRRAVFGDDSSRKMSTDEKIRKSLETQYSEDDRIVPEEVEIRVSDGHVTLVFPQNPRTDVAYAARLAKLTVGVTSVNAIYQEQ